MSTSDSQKRLSSALWDYLEQHLSQSEPGRGLPTDFDWIDEMVAQDESGRVWRVHLHVDVTREHSWPAR